MLTDSALLGELLQALTAVEAALLCCTCHLARALANEMIARPQWYSRVKYGTSHPCAPAGGGGAWTFERLHLCSTLSEATFACELIRFEFASDTLNAQVCASKLPLHAAIITK